MVFHKEKGDGFDIESIFLRQTYRKEEGAMIL